MSNNIDPEVLTKLGELVERLEKYLRENPEVAAVAAAPFFGLDALRMEDTTWFLAFLILRNNQTNAQSFWQLVSKERRAGHPEFGALWTVGNQVWKNDPAGLYKAVGAYQWTPEINWMIVKIKEKYRLGMINGLRNNYGAISENDLGTLTGLSGPEVEELVEEQDGWEFKKERGWFGGRMVKLNRGQGRPTYYYPRWSTEPALIFFYMVIGIVQMLFGFALYHGRGEGHACGCNCQCIDN